MSTQKTALMAVFTALVAILAYMGGFIKIGALASISLTLIPIVIGSALCGPAAGAFLGGVAGAVFFLTADAAFWCSLNMIGTVITVMLKGIASGWLAGLTYKALEKFSIYLAVIAAAVVCPVVNTGIFFLGCMTFFIGAVKEKASASGSSVVMLLFTGFAGLNFVFELLSNIIFSPIIVRILNVRKKQK